jgi:RNA polymerase-binding transcription factor DksA
MPSVIIEQCRAVLDGERRALSELIERQPSDALLGSLREIEDALCRMRHGTFGICEHCKCEIPQDELDDLPAARFCLACADLRSPVICVDADVE